MDESTAGLLVSQLAALHTKFDVFREEYLREHATIANEARRAHDRISVSDKEIERMLGKISEIEKLIPWLKAMAFIVSAMSIPVILAAVGFIWQAITHKIVFP